MVARERWSAWKQRQLHRLRRREFVAVSYGFEAAFLSSYFSNGFQSSFALSNAFSASCTFFTSALPSAVPAHFAPASLIFFSKSATAALYLGSFVLVAPELENA